jgi:hypothetical protein
VVVARAKTVYEERWLQVNPGARRPFQ